MYIICKFIYSVYSIYSMIYTVPLTLSLNVYQERARKKAKAIKSARVERPHDLAAGIIPSRGGWTED